METKETHIDLLEHGDTILHNGEVKTLTQDWIRWCPFMGRSIWGDTYRLGYKPATLVVKL